MPPRLWPGKAGGANPLTSGPGALCGQEQRDHGHPPPARAPGPGRSRGHDRCRRLPEGHRAGTAGRGRRLRVGPEAQLPCEVWEVASRVGYAVLLFLGSLVVAAVFIGSNVLLEWLIGFAVNQETRTYDVVKAVLDILLIGFALVGSTIGGAVIVLKEILSSVKSF